MEGRDLKAHGGAQSKSDHESKEDREESGQGEVEFEASPADRAQNKDGV